MKQDKKKKYKVVASIEARMASSRLPGKMLAAIGNKPVIQHLVDRLRRCSTLDDIVIATTEEKTDDELADWAKKYGVECFRGSENDVLQRVIDSHIYMNTDVIVEITGDCPFTDPDIIDIGVETFLANKCDYLTNCEKFSFPPGLYVQVFTLKSLIKIGKIIEDPAVREHVSLYYYENPDKYNIIHLMSSPKWRLPINTRIYLDYPEDLIFLNNIYEKLCERGKSMFGAEDIVNLLNKEQNLLEINNYLTDVPVRE